MATTQGQDIICCQLCPNPVEHHCNLCHVDLCLSCIPKHMSDKSREHEVVGYTSRKEETVALPTCSTHEKKQCETYCQDCKIPLCIKCLIDSHRGHEVIEIHDILQKQKQQILADIEDMEIILSKYRNVKPTTTNFDIQKVLSDIEEQEDKICKVVHEMSIHLKDTVTNERKEAMKKCEESLTLKNNAEKELNEKIQNNNDILKGNDPTAIINYRSSSNLDFKGPEIPKFSCPQLFPGSIRKDQIKDMFGDFDGEKKQNRYSNYDLRGQYPVGPLDSRGRPHTPNYTSYPRLVYHGNPYPTYPTYRPTYSKPRKEVGIDD
ncbi:E3 ubiquitin-protein ligase TRIM9-like [Saccostrea cucullata]|uniref:E3 ubiquitin-protein ligase TRIM9-like n=1 Tax=Saccostrea cuccullata TaxID=36930 RepID=UPI002ED154AC